MRFNSLSYDYPSRRFVQMASRGMVATSTTLAAQAGLEVMQRGGNAIDAAVATAMCLTVTEPTSNGIGSDAFALVWTGGKLHGLNASGVAPAALSAALLKSKGHKDMPAHGFEPVTVPGAPSAWRALSERFGRLPLADTAQPAIGHAQRGYPVSPVCAQAWMGACAQYKRTLTAPHFKHWFDHFAPDGRGPAPGDIFRSPDMAATLQSIAETGAESFYRGPLMERIVAFSRENGGYFTERDFADYAPLWVEPISLNYRGYDIHEIPPNTHGIAALMALGMLRRFDLGDARETARNYHLQIEAMKLAFADVSAQVGDARSMRIDPALFLSDAYLDERSRLIGETACDAQPSDLKPGGTVYLCAADGEGNMVSYIQSNYLGFGSGLVVPGTGISLHNRGYNFTLDEEHPNALGPGKRPYHTIIPGFITQGGQPVGPFGVMGGFMQPQGHVQTVINTVDFGLNPQCALDAPRWQWNAGRDVDVEDRASNAIIERLIAKGHNIRAVRPGTFMGRGQMITLMESGALAGGTDPRADGGIALW